ncbi:hypothetical protein CSA17_03190 [bacterium DOLJORAL78_65_58]|nr:MAG: hypothetical protein CSB20_14070 [bacterium DOLZORAL124_64_63]PIE76247.1 MAG: hypothetical protein CSA17_03190 [bacterium DOLJORAL78_65_58]
MKFMSFFVLVFVLFWGSAIAADPQVQNATKVDSEQQASSPVLEINQAELEAGVTLDENGTDEALLPQPALSPMMIEIKTALETNHNQVRALAERAAQAPDYEARRALNQEASQLKQQLELDILAIQARYARQDGNEELALKIEDSIEKILNPPMPEAPTETRPEPQNR